MALAAENLIEINARLKEVEAESLAACGRDLSPTTVAGEPVAHIPSKLLVDQVTDIGHRLNVLVEERAKAFGVCLPPSHVAKAPPQAARDYGSY